MPYDLGGGESIDFFFDEGLSTLRDPRRHISTTGMGCGKIFFVAVILLSTALITYNILISGNSAFRQDFPGPSTKSFADDLIIKMPTDKERSSSSKRLFHTAVTSSDSVYNTWQCRIMYYWFKKFKDQPNSQMGGFTRILHSGKPDRFMDEIPTFIAQPLPAGMDQIAECLRHHFAADYR